jgi:hypothetical protein
MTETRAPYVTRRIDVEGLYNWFETLLAELSETDMALRLVTPTASDTTRAILQRVQDMAAQAHRERMEHRYGDARDTLSSAYRVLRLELLPDIEARLDRATDTDHRAALAAWCETLQNALGGDA